MTPAIMTLNVGSSSFKYAIYNAGSKFDLDSAQCIKRGVIELFSAKDQHSHQTKLQEEIYQLIHECADLKLLCVCHRVVHGGQLFSEPAIIDEMTLIELEKLIPLAPMHLTPEIEAIRSIQTQFPHLINIACFDTAFHHGRPNIDQLYGIPKSLSQSGLKRYGFHGLSYDYINRQLPQYFNASHTQKVIVAHLGNGASLCAINNGQCVSTTMGFSALDGLLMGTRCGQIDPGLVLHLIQQEGYGSDEVSHILHHQSGLLGVSGISHDMRELQQNPHPDAQLALDLFVYYIIKEIGAMVAIMGGVNSLVFTGGIGENSALIRSRILQKCEWLKLSINEQSNIENKIIISDENSDIKVLVLPTNEEVILAYYCQAIIVKNKKLFDFNPQIKSLIGSY